MYFNQHLSGPELWPAVAHGLGAERLAQMGRISKDGFRTPVGTMLLGEDHWVTHVDNRIRSVKSFLEYPQLFNICI